MPDADIRLKPPDQKVLSNAYGALNYDFRVLNLIPLAHEDIGLDAEGLGRRSLWKRAIAGAGEAHF